MATYAESAREPLLPASTQQTGPAYPASLSFSFFIRTVGIIRHRPLGAALRLN